MTYSERFHVSMSINSHDQRGTLQSSTLTAVPITDGTVYPQTLVALNTVLRWHTCIVVFSPSVTIAMSIMTINAATNDGVLII